jgi:hypothetical protein
MFGVSSENKDTIFSGITFYVLCFTKTENRKPKTENRKPNFSGIKKPVTVHRLYDVQN